MIRFVTILTLIATPFLFVKSQVTIGSGKSPENFSVLELDSDKGGLRLNQVDATQKEALTTLLQSQNKEAEKGLTIYDLTSKTIQYWDGEKWEQMLGTDSWGTDGQFLQSKGPGKMPEWVTLNIPKVNKGDYYLYSSSTIKDDQGVIVGYENPDGAVLNLDAPLNVTGNNPWHVLDGLTTTINIPDIKTSASGDLTRVAIQFQAGGQISTGVRSKTWTTLQNLKTEIVPSVHFFIGVFIDNKLKIVRPTRIDASGGGMSFSLYSVMGTISSLAPGQRIIKIAVKRGESFNMQDDYVYTGETFSDLKKRISFGCGFEAGDLAGTGLYPNTNPFMTQSSLKIDIYALNTDN